MSRLLSVSVPDDLLEQTESLARRDGTTKSEIVRQALRGYLELQGLRELQDYGRAQAERLGIGPEDIEDLVDEVRAEMGAEEAEAENDG